MTEERDFLREKWHALWTGAKALGDGTLVLDELMRRYGEPHRAYHSARHIAHCLREFQGIRYLPGNPYEVEFALWFHDAIYNTKRKDNEEKSAEWLARVLKGAGLYPQQRGAPDLVLLTKHAAGKFPRTIAGRVVVDIDLAILGSAPGVFDEYEMGIWTEYVRHGGVSEDKFRKKRKEVLERFLERPLIYLTAYFHNKYDAQARLNLRRSLAKLK